jgi:hypothetical protein
VAYDPEQFLKGVRAPFSRQNNFLDAGQYLSAGNTFTTSDGRTFSDGTAARQHQQTLDSASGQSAVNKVEGSVSNLVGDLEAGTVELESFVQPNTFDTPKEKDGDFVEGTLGKNNLPTFSNIRTAIDAVGVGQPINLGRRQDSRRYNIAALDAGGYGAPPAEESFEPEIKLTPQSFAKGFFSDATNLARSIGALSPIKGLLFRGGDESDDAAPAPADMSKTYFNEQPPGFKPNRYETGVLEGLLGKDSAGRGPTVTKSAKDLNWNDVQALRSYDSAANRNKLADWNDHVKNKTATSAGKPKKDGSAGNSGSGSSDRVICTELYKQGKLDMDLYRMDIVYTAKRLSPITVRGYHHWAVPMVVRMRSSTSLSNLFEYLTVARAKEIARIVKPESHKRTLSGFLIKNIGEAICFSIGLFVGQKDWSVLYNGEANNG